MGRGIPTDRPKGEEGEEPMKERVKRAGRAALLRMGWWRCESCGKWHSGRVVSIADSEFIAFCSCEAGWWEIAESVASEVGGNPDQILLGHFSRDSVTATRRGRNVKQRLLERLTDRSSKVALMK